MTCLRTFQPIFSKSNLAKSNLAPRSTQGLPKVYPRFTRGRSEVKPSPQVHPSSTRGPPEVHPMSNLAPRCTQGPMPPLLQPPQPLLQRPRLECNLLPMFDQCASSSLLLEKLFVKHSPKVMMETVGEVLPEPVVVTYNNYNTHGAQGIQGTHGGTQGNFAQKKSFV